MTTLFALSLLQTLYSPQTVAKTLKEAGYAFQPTERQGILGNLTRSGTTVQLGMALGPNLADQKNPPRVAGIVLTVEIPVGVDVPLREANRGYGSFIPRNEIYAIPHLGRTVTLTRDIDFREGLSVDRLRNDLDKFWRDGTEYARRHGGTFTVAPPRNWSKVPFPDSTIVDRSDGPSMDRLAASWGWKAAPVNPYAWRFRAATYNLGGTVVTLDPEPFAHEPHGSAYDMIATVQVKGDPARWIARERARHREFDFSNSAGPGPAVNVSRKLDVGRKITAGDLRRRILNFAATVAKMPRT